MFDIVILDEAHHICTRQKIKLLENVTGRMYLFTATP